jgi:opacity protein-like surface antigen
VLCLVFTSAVAAGQNLCPLGVASDKLICVIPQLFGVNGLQVANGAHQGHFQASFLDSSFAPLSSSIARQSALVPLASPSSGITFAWDASAKVFTASTDSFGPVLSDRAETLGRHRLFLAFDYQYFNFDSIDGISLRRLPVVLTHADDAEDNPGTLCTVNPDPTAFNPPQSNTGGCGFVRDVVRTNNSIDLKIHQFTTFVTFGLTSRIDVSVAIPIENVRMGAFSDATIGHNDSDSRFDHVFTPRTGCPPPGELVCLEQPFSNVRTASGIGDITLRVKGIAWKGERAGVALGVDVRVPTGDSLNFLGAGAAGVRPFVAWSYRARVSPHAVVGYEANGSSVIAGDITTGKKDKLPGALTYSAGADFWVTKRLTVAADIVGQQVFQVRRTTMTTFTELGQCQDSATQVCDPDAGFLAPHVDPVISQSTESYNATNLSLGVRVKPLGSLLLTGNVLIKLNDGGLRAKFVPLVGLSYTF